MIIKNARILSPEILEDVYNIYIEENKIKKISKESIDKNDSEIIDVNGMYVTPGLIDAHTHLGLKADSMGDFYSEHNEKNSVLSPHLRAIDGLNSQMKTIKEAREAGITLCATGPGSLNIIGGQYAVIKTLGNTTYDMVINPYFAMKTALGENPKKAYNMTRMGIASTLREFLLEAKEYEKKHDKYDKKLEAMIPVVRKEKPLKIHCHQGNDIETAIRICEELDIPFTLDHVTGGVEVLDFLNTRKEIPLLLGPSLGSRGKVELVGKSFENVVKLAEGRDVCIITDAPVIPLQYLPICVGLAISKGMPYEKALESVTINPARVMGVDSEYGSISENKIADIVVWEDKPFITIQDPKYVIMGGKIVFKKK